VANEYLGNDYEWNGTAGVKYCHAGGERVATLARAASAGVQNAGGTLYFLLAITCARPARCQRYRRDG